MEKVSPDALDACFAAFEVCRDGDIVARFGRAFLRHSRIGGVAVVAGVRCREDPRQDAAVAKPRALPPSSLLQ
jgi:hypothetical protein